MVQTVLGLEGLDLGNESESFLIKSWKKFWEKKLHGSALTDAESFGSGNHLMPYSLFATAICIIDHIRYTFIC